VHVAAIGLDKEEAGRVPLLEIGQCRDPVARVVIDGEFAQPQYRAVVLDHALRLLAIRAVRRR
jgi:hypothetical protein